MVKLVDLVRERMARFFHGLLLWATRQPSQSQRLGAPNHYDEHTGLACVVCSSQLQHRDVRQGRILHSCMVKSCSFSRPSSPAPKSSLSWLSSSSAPSWSLSTDGDLLGTESGVHMCRANDPLPWEEAESYTSRKQQMRNRGRKKKWDIPPPLTILRDHEAYGGQIPWGLQREYREGRLILRELAAEQFHIQETVREDGFLYMDIVTTGNSSTATEEDGELAQKEEGNNAETEKGMRR